MPMPNFHSCRIRDPESVTDPRGQKRRKHKGKEYRVNYATDKESKKMVEQSYRYDKQIWDADEARAHCKEHAGIEFSEATGDESLAVNPITSQCWVMEPTALVRLATWAASVAPESIATDASVVRGPRLQKAAGAVAVMRLVGLITQRGGGFLDFFMGGTHTDAFGRAFDELMADDSVDAILFDVDSPGGTVFGTPELAEKIFSARGRKQIVAVGNSLATSAAYWIPSAADKFYVTPAGQTASIGVWNAHVDISKAEEQIGIKTTLVSAGKYKIEGHPWAPLDDEARASLQHEVDGYYDQFIEAVAKHRGVSPATVRNGYGQGRVLSAQDALSEKMIDGIYTFEEVLKSLTGDSAARRRAAAQANDQEAAQQRLYAAQAELLVAGENCATVPGNPSGGSGVGVEGEWSKPSLGDFTDKSWEDLSEGERARIGRHFGWYANLETFGGLKLPHHFPPNHANAGKASLNGARNALARLNQTQGIPESERGSVEGHLKRHLPTEE